MFFMHVFNHMVKDINTASGLDTQADIRSNTKIHFQQKHQIAYSVLSNVSIYSMAHIMTNLHTQKQQQIKTFGRLQFQVNNFDRSKTAHFTRLFPVSKSPFILKLFISRFGIALSPL